MSALIRFFTRRKKKDKIDCPTQNLVEDLQKAKSTSTRYHRTDIECKIMNLDESEYTFFLPKKSLAGQLYEYIYQQLQFVQEEDYFGLQYTDTRNINHWLDPTKQIRKQCEIGPPYTLKFRVKFYSSDPHHLRDEFTRYLFVLQLKRDLRSGRLDSDPDTAADLAALCLQGEFGDFDAEEHTPGFISQFRFLPDSRQTESFELSVLHKYEELRGRFMTPAQSDKQFLEKVRLLDNYGVDMHLVKGKDSSDYTLGLTPTGILIYEGNTKIGLFYWPMILKLEFRKARLKLVVADEEETTEINEHTFVFTLPDPRACKHLWKCAVEHHTFFRLIDPHRAPSKRQQVFRLRSRFHSSFRTEYQLHRLNSFGTSSRRTASFTRQPSRRFSSRPNFEKADLERKRKQIREERKEAAANAVANANSNDPSRTSVPPLRESTSSGQIGVGQPPPLLAKSSSRPMLSGDISVKVTAKPAQAVQVHHHHKPRASSTTDDDDVAESESTVTAASSGEEEDDSALASPPWTSSRLGAQGGHSLMEEAERAQTLLKGLEIDPVHSKASPPKPNVNLNEVDSGIAFSPNNELKTANVKSLIPPENFNRNNLSFDNSGILEVIPNQEGEGDFRRSTASEHHQRKLTNIQIEEDKARILLQTTYSKQNSIHIPHLNSAIRPPSKPSSRIPQKATSPSLDSPPALPPRKQPNSSPGPRRDYKPTPHYSSNHNNNDVTNKCDLQMTSNIRPPSFSSSTNIPTRRHDTTDSISPSSHQMNNNFQSYHQPKPSGIRPPSTSKLPPPNHQIPSKQSNNIHQPSSSHLPLRSNGIPSPSQPRSHPSGVPSSVHVPVRPSGIPPPRSVMPPGSGPRRLGTPSSPLRSTEAPERSKEINAIKGRGRPVDDNSSTTESDSDDNDPQSPAKFSSNQRSTSGLPKYQPTNRVQPSGSQLSSSTSSSRIRPPTRVTASPAPPSHINSYQGKGAIVYPSNARSLNRVPPPSGSGLVLGLTSEI